MNFLRPTACLAATTFALLGALPAMAQPAAASAADVLAKAAAEAGASVTPSGLVYRSLKDGTGPQPEATDTVSVHYRGTFPDGKEFDSSYSRGKPTSFPLNRVIKCWTEGVQRIKVASPMASAARPVGPSHPVPCCNSKSNCWGSLAPKLASARYPPRGPSASGPAEPVPRREA